MMVRPRDLAGTFGLDLGDNYLGVQFPILQNTDFALPDFDNEEDIMRVYLPIICEAIRFALLFQLLIGVVVRQREGIYRAVGRRGGGAGAASLNWKVAERGDYHERKAFSPSSFFSR